ncbi:MAG TPA: AAA family ATPase, partial [Chloroflexota bacterium]|nr:AAA family ATPase [Chloroflexota bacterium]
MASLNGTQQRRDAPLTPYKGLIPYAEEDAAFFFGRDAERDLIVANLAASRLTLLYGPSGVGKSSLLNAGVASYLRTQQQQQVRLLGNPEAVVVVFNSWRDDPIRGLAEAIQTTVRHAWDTSYVAAPPHASGSEASSSSARPFLDVLRSGADLIDGDLIVILDQFEEYFLYHGQEDGAGTFAAEFPRAVNSAAVRASFLVSVREDALAKLDRFEGRIPNLFSNYLRVEHLDRDSAREAIERPIGRYNRELVDRGHNRTVQIEPALVEAVLDQIKTGRVLLGETGLGVFAEHEDERPTRGEHIETPYLQLVMRRLWAEDVESNGGDRAPANRTSTIRRATLERLGGAERIVRTHLDATMETLTPHQRDVAAGIFHYLVTPSGTKIDHSAADLAEYARLSEAEVGPVLEIMAGSNARVLQPIAPPLDQPDVVRYEIFHDVLAPAILDWRTRYAQAQERAASELELAAERRRVWRLRVGLVGVTVLLLAVVGLAFFAVQQRD